MIIETGPLIALPDDPQQWVLDTMGDAAPSDSRFVLGEMIKTETESGWPVRVVEARFSAADNTTVESRLGAFYRFFEYGAAAVVRYRSTDLDLDLAREAKGILATAEPDFSSSVIAVFQLWADVVLDPSGS